MEVMCVDLGLAWSQTLFFLMYTVAVFPSFRSVLSLPLSRIALDKFLHAVNLVPQTYCTVYTLANPMRVVWGM